MGWLIVALLVFPAWAADIHVATDGSVDPGCGDMGNACASLSLAAARCNGDTIVVAAGVYQGATNRGIEFSVDCSVAGVGASEVTLDCQGTASVALTYLSGSSGAVSGMTITNCVEGVRVDGAPVSVADMVFESNNFNSVGGIYGGPVSCHNAGGGLTVTGSTFSGNSNHLYGAGVFVMATSEPVLIEDCTFVNNIGTEGGGAVCIFDGVGTTITRCTFDDNIGKTGGAVLAWEELSMTPITTISDCVFNSNYASNDGGAIYHFDGRMMVDKCIFTANSATTSGTFGRGGAIRTANNEGARQALTTITGSTFDLNVAQYGGAVTVGGGASSNTQSTIEDCTFSANSAIGTVYTVEASSSSILRDSLFDGNLGAAYVARKVAITVEDVVVFDGDDSGQGGALRLLTNAGGTVTYPFTNVIVAENTVATAGMVAESKTAAAFTGGLICGNGPADSSGTCTHDGGACASASATVCPWTTGATCTACVGLPFSGWCPSLERCIGHHPVVGAFPLCGAGWEPSLGNDLCVDPALSTLSGPGLEVGSTDGTFTITVFNVNGNPKTLGGDLFSVNVQAGGDDFLGTITDVGDGTHTVVFLVPFTDDYTITVTYMGAHVGASPLVVAKQASPPPPPPSSPSPPPPTVASSSTAATASTTEATGETTASSSATTTECIPSTCVAAGASCGSIGDGCGRILSCGDCDVVGESCGAVTPNRCDLGACFTTTCERASKTCGTFPDGCEGVLECGTCPTGFVCSNNVCSEAGLTSTTATAATTSASTTADVVGQAALLEPTPTKEGSSSGAIIGVIAALLVCAVAVVALLLFKKQRDQAKQLRAYRGDDEGATVALPKSSGIGDEVRTLIASKKTKKLGEGAGAVVYKIKLSEGTVAAVKCMKKKATAFDRDAFHKEVNILSSLCVHPHPCVVQFMFFIDSLPALGMECCDNGSLYRLLHASSDPLSAVDKYRYCIQVASALEFCHFHDVAHLDVKTKNVLVGADGVLKLADFGISIIVSADDVADATDMTPQYVAPERVKTAGLDARFSLDFAKCDVFSCGILMWSVWTQKPPFADVPSDRVINLIPDGLRPDLPDDIAPEFAHVVTKAWHTDPATRSSMPEVVDALVSVIRGACNDDEDVLGSLGGPGLDLLSLRPDESSFRSRGGSLRMQRRRNTGQFGSQSNLGSQNILSTTSMNSDSEPGSTGPLITSSARPAATAPLLVDAPPSSVLSTEGMESAVALHSE